MVGMSTSKPVTAGIYVRISEDAAGQGLGVQRQEQDCRDKAQTLGWTVHHVYSDNDVSATRSKSRPQYQAMIADIQAGVINGVVVYSLDRLTRKPSELEDFINLTEQYQTRLANVSGEVDLSSANGKMVARLMGAMARAETDKMGERVSRQRLQSAQMGKPDGGRYRLYGYDREWNIVEPEAAVVRKMFEMHVNGSNVTAIMRYMASQTDGKYPPTGKTLVHNTVKGLLQNSRYAAILPFKGSEYAGNWTAIIPEETYRASQAKWNGKKMPAGHNTRKSLLPGFLYCGECDSPLHSRPGTKRYARSYGCKECHKVTFKMEWLDDVILKEVAFRAKRTKHEVRTTVDYTDQIAAIERNISDLQDGYQRGELNYADYAVPLKELRKQLATLTTAQGEQEAVKQQQTWFRNYADLKKADLSVKRDFIAQHVKAIRVDKSRKLGGAKGPDLHRLTVSWADGYDEILGMTDDAHRQVEVWQEEE